MFNFVQDFYLLSQRHSCDFFPKNNSLNTAATVSTTYFLVCSLN